MSLRSVTALQMYSCIPGMLLASCKAILVTNLPAWPTSPPPREKKKLAPRLFRSKNVRATVRAIVDFPVPAKPLSQKMHCLSPPSAHSCISRRSSTRVFWRHVGSCCFANELKGASLAYGKLLSGLSSPNLLISVQSQPRRGRSAHGNCTSLQGEPWHLRRCGHHCRHVRMNSHPSRGKTGLGRTSRMWLIQSWWNLWGCSGAKRAR
jgi:hypothetical protein